MVYYIKRNIKNILGSKTNRKLVAFFVDDYGSVRTRDKEALKLFKDVGIRFSENFSFSKYDTLESNQDIEFLFEVLAKHRDFKGRNVCFTPFTIVANPDFEKIRSNNFKEYYREPFVETLKKYGKNHDNVFSLLKEGIKLNIFHPVYHGTEHINVKRFMQALRDGHKSTLLAFQQNSICIPAFYGEKEIVNPTANFDLDSLTDNISLAEDIEIGLKLFEKIFGYRTSLFAPGAAKYHPDLNSTLFENDIKYINVNRKQLTPIGNNIFRSKYYYNGKFTNVGQRYIVRNAVFEPHGRENNAIIENCLKDIKAAFAWKSPAIISSHRVNFVGSMDKNWRSKSLIQLDLLIKEILKNWPDVEFVNGDDLCQIMFEEENAKIF